MDSSNREFWRFLFEMARPFRRQFGLVALLAVLATGTDLLEPLIYRAAVNDIAGLFVGAPGERGIDSMADGGDSPGAEDVEGPVAAKAGAPPPSAEREPHARGRVAARTPEQTFTTLMWAVALLLAVSVLGHALALAADQQTAVLASRLEAQVIQRTFAHLLKLPLGFFNARRSAGLSKQVNQLDQVAPIVTAVAHEVAPEALRIAGVLAIMMTQSWHLALVVILTLPPYLWIVRRSASRLESGLDTYYDLWEGVSARIQDAVGSIKTLKLSGAEARESARLREDSDAAYAVYLARNRLANQYTFWQSSISFVSQALVLAYGGWLVLERQLTPGDVVMFVVYLGKLYEPLETLTGLGVRLQEHKASLQRAVRLLKNVAEAEGGAAPSPGPGRVEFRAVRFGYSSKRPVLQGLDLVLEPGTVTALVGPSGAGKTTAVDLLLRLYEPDSGDVLLDGQRIGDLDPSAVRREIGLVSADGALFRGSIADNIRYKWPAATAADVQAAAEAAGLRAMIERLPEGLETQVGEGGVGLSLGERQRLQIARALVGRPRVLILDEATANLDFATESELRRAVLQRPGRPTTLVIAHRFSMMEGVDHVYVLDRGRVAEQGTVAALQAADGWFAAFARSAQEGADAAASPAGAIASDGGAALR